MNALRVYQGNPNLKAAGEKIPFTQEQFDELVKCAQDPIYFVENYVKIVTIDNGLQPMKLYDFQKRIIKGILIDSNRVASACARQMGKCEHPDTKLYIRNKKSQSVIEITIGNFHKWMEFREALSRFDNSTLRV